MKMEITLNEFDEELWNQILEADEIEEVGKKTYLSYREKGYPEEVAVQYLESKKKDYAIAKAIKLLYEELRENG